MKFIHELEYTLVNPIPKEEFLSIINVVYVLLKSLDYSLLI